MRRAEFEGEEVVAGVYKLSAAAVGLPELNRDLGLDERVVVVCIAECVKVEHAADDDGTKRVHTLKVKEAYAGDQVGEVGELLRELRAEQRRKLDELRGVMALEGVET